MTESPSYTRLRRVRRAGDQRGFTLIELLVVIVILGILSAVVVFAVRGVGDKGLASSVEIDERTIRTAEEAYCGAKNSYGSGKQLVDGGFLSELPTYHQVDAQTTGGPCNGSKFTILRTAKAGEYPGGSWTPVAAPGIADTNYLVRLADGRVLAGGDDGTGRWITRIWNPAVDAASAWTTIGSPPDLPAGANTAILLTNDPLTPQNECQSAPTAEDNCGKVFLYGRYLFDPKVTTVGPGQWERLTTCSFCNGGPSNFLANFSFVQMKRTIGQCSPNCGKIFIFPPNGMVDIFNPSDKSFTTRPIDQDPGATGNYVHQLSDGRLLVCCANDFGNAAKATFFDPVQVKYSGDADMPPSAAGWRREAAPQPGPVLPNGDLLFLGIIDNPVDNGVYTPQPAPGLGSFKSPNAKNCVPGSFTLCRFIGTLPDGRILAQAGSETYVFNPATASWSRTGDLFNSSSFTGLAAVSLDPAAGACGTYCGKILVAGNNSAEVYSA